MEAQVVPPGEPEPEVKQLYMPGPNAADDNLYIDVGICILYMGNDHHYNAYKDLQT